MKETNTVKKKPYTKPELKVINLAAEEVLATGCKTMVQGAPYSPVSCIANNCMGLGS